MFAKIEITGVIEVVTGMHIGGSSAFAAIGAVDSPVIRDAATNLPMIPGSSLKGKMRTLLAKKYNTDISLTPEDDDKRLTRLFGSAKKGNIQRSRILISDMVLSNVNELKNQGVQSVTEVKFENTINRLTAQATPRQIERSVRGSKYNLNIIYEIDVKSKDPENEMIEDFNIIAEGFKLLEYDYLGGSGSRGYGKVKFKDLNADVVIGEVDEDVLKKCNDALRNE